MKHSPQRMLPRASRLAARALAARALAARALAAKCSCALACFILSSPAFAQYAPIPISSAHATIDRLYWDHVESFCIADSIGNDIYTSSRERLYHTSDGGKTWSKLGELPNVTLIKEIIPISRNVIFVNTSKGFAGTAFLSVDSGHNFCPCLQSTGGGACAWFLRGKGILYVASQKPFQLMESNDSGISWTAVGNIVDTITEPRICSLLIQGPDKETRFYLSTSAPATIYTTANLAGKWQKCFTDRLRNYNREVPLVTSWGNRLVACIASGPHGPMDKIYLSDNHGVAWRAITCPFNIWGIGVTASDMSTMWIGNYGEWPKSDTNMALRYSRDAGQTWNVVPNCHANIFWQLEELSDHSLYAATDFGLIHVKLNE